ncbi:MAG: ATP-dependent RecD-like DNA helicase [bacterium]
MPRDPKAEVATLVGTVEKIVFTNPENGFTVLRVRVEGEPRLVPVVGNMPPLSPGESACFTGSWTVDKRFGRQFQAHEFALSLPSTLKGLVRYLSSGVCAGVGDEMAKRIVDAFGEQTLSIIDDSPERLTEVEGIGPVRARKIREGWERERGVREVMVFLQGHDISARLAQKIWKAYGSHSIERLRANPYAVAEEITGIGWKTADRIAHSLGVPPDHPSRIEAGMLFLLREKANQGHVCAGRETLESEVAQLLDADLVLSEGAARRLLETRRLVERVDAERGSLLFLPHFDLAEEDVANDLSMLASARRSTPPLNATDVARMAVIEGGIDLGEQQLLALESVFSERVLIVTGGPGTGKTTLVRTVIRLLERLGESFILAAPTGRAAKRLTEATGRPAGTLHRLLEWDPRTGAFGRGPARLIDASVVIVDEASMIDLLLMQALSSAVPNGSLLMLVGDTDQLPPVGPGNVLRDIIASDIGRVVLLDKIYRQAERSLIVRNAHRVNRGEMIETIAEARGDQHDSPSDGTLAPVTRDFQFIESAAPAESLATLKRLVAETLVRDYGLDPFRDLQVLSPMYRGVLGVDNLNESLQALLNPSGRVIARGDGVFRVGDKVMQVRNNYQKEVWNGDVGRVSNADEDARELLVEFDGRVVTYEWEELDELSLAYACSVHKAQGSEYRAVILPLHTEHFVMLRRNLLYTAITRGREWVFLIGDRRALSMAIRTAHEDARLTMLTERIRARAAGLHSRLN